jgi:hypothetical protein
MAGAPIF